MNIFVTGRTGFVGRHVIRELSQREGVAVTENLAESDAIIHLAWAGLPNYESEDHYMNVGWQMDFLRLAVGLGVRNITITGTCVESVPNPPHYGKAKIELFKQASVLLPELKWVRLWYLYGEGQKDYCLLPSLKRAIHSGTMEFHVVDAERDFINVSDAAKFICDAAIQNKVTGIMDCCSGIAESVASFCRRHANESLSLIPDYPAKDYEPKSFHGIPTIL